MPTIGTFAQLLPARFETRPYRSSDSTVHVCLTGAGRANVADRSFDFGRRDVFVTPSWQAFSLLAAEETIVFSFSDRPVQQVLGLWREERL